MRKFKQTSSTKLLAPNAFYMTNKIIAHSTSHHAAALLAELIGKRNYYEKNEQLTEDDAFFATNENLAWDCAISKREFTTARKKLIDAGLIMKEVMGLPAKTYYIINDEAIEEMINSNEVSQYMVKTTPKPNRFNRLTETGKLGIAKRSNCNDRNGQTNNKNIVNNNIERKNKMTNKTNASAPVAKSLGLSHEANDEAFMEEVAKDFEQEESIIDMTGDGLGNEDAFYELPASMKSGKIKIVRDDLLTEDYFYINMVAFHDEANLGTYTKTGEKLLEDAIYNVKEHENNAVGELYDILTAGLDKVKVWSATDRDIALIEKIANYELSEGDIAGKIIENVDKVLRGKKKLRFGQLFVGLDEINNALEMCKAS